jgi:hypothetical protein
MTSMFVLCIAIAGNYSEPIQNERIRPTLNYQSMTYDECLVTSKYNKSKVVVFVGVSPFPIKTEQKFVVNYLPEVPAHKDWAEFRDGGILVGNWEGNDFVRVGKLSREDSTPEKLNVILNSSIRPVLFTPDTTFNQQRFQPFQTLRTCIGGNCPLQR